MIRPVDVRGGFESLRTGTVRRALELLHSDEVGHVGVEASVKSQVADVVQGVLLAAGTVAAVDRCDRDDCPDREVVVQPEVSVRWQAAEAIEFRCEGYGLSAA